LPRRAVPITSVRRGLAPPKHVTCLAHKKAPHWSGAEMNFTGVNGLTR
jgi:hypothetical protein